MNIGRINELPVQQNAQRNQDAIGMPRFCVKCTIKNLLTSGATAYVSWNVSGSKANPLAPGESVTYWHDGYYLDGNDLYVTFDANASDGIALVSFINDSLQEVKKPIC